MKETLYCIFDCIKRSELKNLVFVVGIILKSRILTYSTKLLKAGANYS